MTSHIPLIFLLSRLTRALLSHKVSHQRPHGMAYGPKYKKKAMMTYQRSADKMDFSLMMPSNNQNGTSAHFHSMSFPLSVRF